MNKKNVSWHRDGMLAYYFGNEQVEITRKVANGHV